MNTQPKVIVFSTPTCSWCTTVKQYLKKNKIRFRDIDITKDERAAKDMVRRTKQQGVPVTLVNNRPVRPVIGFNKLELNKLLNIKG